MWYYDPKLLYRDNPNNVVIILVNITLSSASRDRFDYIIPEYYYLLWPISKIKLVTSGYYNVFCIF